MTQHSVEKIGGTTMSRSDELIDTLFAGGPSGPYNRILVVSAYGGVTDLLLENKKTGEPGVYGLFVEADSNMAWAEALDRAAKAMAEVHGRLLDHPADKRAADEFLRDRIDGARNCLIDLQRLCSYGHFTLDEHLRTVRELVSGLGEAHSAHTTALLLRRNGIEGRFVDLSGWRDDTRPDLDGRIRAGLEDVDLTAELPVVTGYAQCTEGLMAAYDRGYSEVTFSRIAAVTGAAEAVIHKEFHLSSADPRLVGEEAVRKIGRTNYDVADQLSNLGMEAIHPRAAKILRQAGVPLRVANAFEPQDPGTLIEDAPGREARVEMVTGLDVFAIEVFEQDMVGTKGYDAAILEALTRHKLWIVSKSSNANTITHYVNATFKGARRAERDIRQQLPGATVTVAKLAIVSAIGQSLEGLSVVRRGLGALEAAGIRVVAVQQTARPVDAQFVVDREDRDKSIAALHTELVENAPTASGSDEPLRSVAAPVACAA